MIKKSDLIEKFGLFPTPTNPLFNKEKDIIYISTKQRNVLLHVMISLI